ncbi:hypothetical protein N865_19305 [Intrasporangium oryzae NRRL B-24470]|uniref:Uncharacterized protein n=1 Tax=Intrasporangium oryzae NRRL B-24470 TaxID=1386089 RepID=W9GHL3_9MICO|nr:hypothetical protein [Intrasporangium oryzae]EWT03379.1 hypothetical protein N865_19305 [Intrasporangium oryzae NRRL B-24470]
MTTTTFDAREPDRTNSNAGRYDAPWDYTKRTGLLAPRAETHRFPAPIYLRADRVREERTVAQQALAASDRTSSRRIGAAAGAVLVLLIGLAALYLTGLGSDSSPIGQIVTLEAAVVVAVLAFVGLLRRRSVAHEQLEARARLYDVRLAELQREAQRMSAQRPSPQRPSPQGASAHRLTAARA